MADKKKIDPKGHEFIFTEGEQKFFKDKGFSEPKNCPECRAERKAEKERR